MNSGVTQSIKTGFSAIGEQDIETAFQTVKIPIFDFVEVQMNYWDESWLQSNADRIQSLASEANAELIVHLPFGTEKEALGASDPTIQDTALDRYKSCIEAARSIGAKKGVLHVETTKDSPHLATVGKDDELVKILQKIANFAHSCDFELCVENLPNRYPDLSHLETLVEKIDLQLTVDTGHAIVNEYSDEDVAKFVGEYGNRICHFHLNDTRRQHDEHLPFGSGTIDFDRIFAALPADWQGTMTVEIDTFDYDYIEFSGEKLQATLERNVRMSNSSVETEKQPD